MTIRIGSFLGCGGVRVEGLFLIMVLIAMSSRLSITATWSTFTQRPVLLHGRMEAGTLDVAFLVQST